MAIRATIEDIVNEREALYIRLDHISSVSGDGSTCWARVRGYESRLAFLAKRNLRWEGAFEFIPDITLPLWPQAYAALKDLLAASGDPLAAKLSGGKIDDVLE